MGGMPNVKRKLLGNTGTVVAGTSVVRPCAGEGSDRSNSVLRVGSW